MTGLRAVGVRAPWSDMPEDVRAWVADGLGSPISSVEEQTGGMSPGCATRIACADGRRVFVKAVGTPLNPETPTLFRREALVLDLIGADPLWARLLSVRDSGDWVTLVLEDVDGHHPDLADDSQMERLCEATDRLGSVLRDRAPDARPGPPGSPGPKDLADRFETWAASFGALDRVPDDRLPAWVRSQADTLADGVRRLSGSGPRQLLHWDIRNDNLLVRPGGELVFVDWGMASVGPAWLDPLLARMERVESPWFDESVSASPALVAAGNDAVTSFLVGMGVQLAVRSVDAVDINLPTLQAFRLTESARLLAAAARRLGV